MADDYTVKSADDEHLEEGESLVTSLPEDNDRPFSEPDDTVSDAAADPDAQEEGGRLSPMHQTTDNATDIDSHQLYDEGLAGAAEASEPNAGNAVLGYDPEKDQRKSPPAAT